MINYLLLSICLLLTSCASGSPVEQGNTPSFDTTKVISESKKEINAINSKISTYNTVEKEINDESAEGAVLIGYYDKNELRKIVGVFYGETGKILMEYYKKDSYFFYVNSKVMTYKVPIYVNSSGEIQSIEECMYYFCHENLLQWQIGDSDMIAFDSLEFLDKNKHFKEKFAFYKRLFSDYTASEKGYQKGDTVRCKYGISCQSTGFVIKGSRTSAGGVQHVPAPANKKVFTKE